MRPSSPSHRSPAFRLAGAVAGALVLLGLSGLTLSAPSAADVAPTRSVQAQAGWATTLTLTVAPPVVARGRPVSLVGRLTDSATGAGVVGAPVQAETMTPEGGWVAAAGVTTDGAGAVAVALTPESSATYRLHSGTAGSPEESVSTPVTVTVAELTAELSAPAVRVGRRVTVDGTLAVGGPHRLRVERRVAGSWQELARTTTGADGSYQVALAPAAPAYWRLRVVRGPRTAPVATAELPRLDVFRLHTYSVRTRGAVRADLAEFRSEVAATYADRRGWLRAHHRFRAVTGGRPGDFTVVLAQARYLPSFSWGCSAAYSCRVGRTVVINETRWRTGSPAFPGTLEQYRQMVVNHETGHWLGRPHASCPRPGRPAPVMQQQSKGMHGCRANPWPLRSELRAVE